MYIRLFRNRISFCVLFFFVCVAFSCKRQLDVKPLQSLSVPSTAADLQAILDNLPGMNKGISTGLGEALTDNYYVTTADWQSLSVSAPNDKYARGADETQNYVWDPAATHLNSWRYPYTYPIYRTNNVLDLLGGIAMDAVTRDALRGAALFYRSFHFFALAQVYCRPYSSTASTDPGIVLKQTSDINEPLLRSTVAETYELIIRNLKESVRLLPIKTLFSTRPNKAAAYGMLARTYLSMREYSAARLYADSCLQLHSALMDYNTVSLPFPWSNPEVIYSSFSYTFSLIYYGKVDTLLYGLYHSDDLRKTLFFTANTGSAAGTYSFHGAYVGGVGSAGDYSNFDGIATDEQLLIRAECAARVGNTAEALKDLNTLLTTRWKSGKFIPIEAASSTVALEKVLTERRKELCFRQCRWSDLRRFNLEGANITLTRIINGVTYTLPPNDPRWVALIPWDIVQLPGIPQNDR